MKTYTRKKKIVNQEIKDVLDMCRLCLNKLEGGVPIFKDSKDVCAVLAMRIMICVGLEMTYEDHLPNKICLKCSEELEKYYKFRRKCEMSYHKLKSHVLAVKERKINDEHTLNNDLITKIPLEDDTHGLLENKGLSENKNEVQQIDVKKLEAKDELKEVEIPIETTNAPDIATFLTTVLKELGVLVQRESGLVVEHDSGPYELEVNGEQMMVELVEEDDEELQTPQVFPEKKPEPATTAVLPDNAEVKQIHRKGVKKKGGAWCEVCGRVFSSVSGARRHAARHGGPRHSCPACSRTFAQRACWQRHMRLHGERPYKCPSCPKSFTQRGGLDAHARSHHAPKTLLLHRCTLCDKLFLYASGLSRHMLSHAGAVFECATCHRQFNDRSSMTRHVKMTHPHVTGAD